MGMKTNQINLRTTENGYAIERDPSNGKAPKLVCTYLEGPGQYTAALAAATDLANKVRVDLVEIDRHGRSTHLVRHPVFG